MDVLTFSCPYCSSPLRLRDRAFVDREVGCPDCGERIEIRLDRDQEPIARKASEPPEKAPAVKLPPRKSRAGRKRTKKTAEARKEEPGSPDVPKSPRRHSRWPLIPWAKRFTSVPGVLLSPVGIAWTVAGLVGLMLLILAWPAGESAGGDSPEEQTTEDSGSSHENPFEIPDELPAALPVPEVPGEKIAGDVGIVGDRLKQFGIDLKAYADQRGHFPSGTVNLGNHPASNRFSWLAEMFAKHSAGRIAEPQWDQSWRDPLNDRFVRQQQEPFLNPLIPRKVGPDRYPATHFVGVAGIGADGPALPVDHPRAGIFGIDRVTRRDDVIDGLENTMMVAGVMDQLGSWAAGGPPTIRAFTQEPYLEGPDGFGTGEAEGMSVLMADGSVRFLSKDTAPVIVRRMAAMADGWPLDETVPGEPGDRPPKESVPEPPAIAQAKPEPQQVEVHKPEPPVEPDPPMEPAPEPVKPVDIPKALAVKIVKFEQLRDVPFQELLYQVEELTGVPIRPDADLPPADAEFWSRPVSLSLKQASVREILDALLVKAELKFTIESDHIQLHSARE